MLELNIKLALAAAASALAFPTAGTSIALAHPHDDLAGLRQVTKKYQSLAVAEQNK